MTRRPLERPGRRIVRPSEPSELTEAQQRRALAELAKRAKAKKSIDFARLCHPKQRAFVEDPNPLVAACCSRRGGKSWGLVYKMLGTAQKYDWSLVPFITGTRGQAKRNVWPVLQRVDHELGLGGKFNHTDLSYRLPNRAQIQLFGANDEAEVERLRGSPFPLAVIDEAQSIRGFLERLIDEIIEPAMADFGGGQIVLAGTPSPACIGFFHDVSTGKKTGWSNHHWTIEDNPHLPGLRTREAIQAWLAALRKRRGWTLQTPKYRREYGGLWVRDEASQVYQITARNLVESFPEGEGDWEYVLGIDLGFVGVSAFVVLAFSVATGQVVVVESYQFRPDHFGEGTLLLTPDHLASEVEKLRRRYDFCEIVVDPGGLGAKFIEDARRRFRLPLKPAEKKAKLGAIEVLNGDLQSGRLLIVEHANKDLVHDAYQLEWSWDKVDKNKHGGVISRADLIIDQKTPDHLLDALTYAHRACRVYLHETPEEDRVPKRGTPEYEAWLDAERDRRIIEASREEESKPWWARDPGDPDPIDDFPGNVSMMDEW